MEWNGKYYFEHPWNGPIYRVPPGAIGQLVNLGKEKVQLVDKGDYVEIAAVTSPDPVLKVFKAEKVYDPADGVPTFVGDWEPIIKIVNAAAAVNTVLKVVLPPEEYKRLSENKEAFSALKKKFSPRAESLLIFDDWDENPGLYLLHTCSCCH